MLYVPQTETGKSQLGQHEQSTLTETEGQETGTSAQSTGWPGPSSEREQDG